MFEFWRAVTPSPKPERARPDRELIDDSFVETVLAGAGLDAGDLRPRPSRAARASRSGPPHPVESATILEAARSIA